MQQVRDFARSQCGAITADWTVLTTAFVGLGLAVSPVIATAVDSQLFDMEDIFADGVQDGRGYVVGIDCQFSEGCDDWQIGPYGSGHGASVNVDDSLGSVSGDGALVITGSATVGPDGNSYGRAVVGGLLPDEVDPGTYALTYWVRTESGNAHIHIMNYTNEEGMAFGFGNNAITSEWTQFTTEVTIEEGDTLSSQLLITLKDPNQTVAFDDIQLTRVRN